MTLFIGSFMPFDNPPQKHLKRKEYNTVLEFANDVELVFSNALQFNMEHTPIWEDTIVLRVGFLSTYQAVTLTRIPPRTTSAS